MEYSLDFWRPYYSIPLDGNAAVAEILLWYQDLDPARAYGF